MDAHLLITPASASRLYACGVSQESGVKSDFVSEIEQRNEINLSRFGCQLVIERRSGLFFLRYCEYLSEVSTELVGMGVEVVGAELIRFRSAPTRARAGSYAWPRCGVTATVERVLPEAGDHETSGALYAQNVSVQGPSLQEVLECNSKLSQGHCGRFLVHSWE